MTDRDKEPLNKAEKSRDLSPHKRSRSAIALSRLSTSLSHKSSSSAHQSTDHLNAPNSSGSMQKESSSPTLPTSSCAAALASSPTALASNTAVSETGSVRSSTTKSLRKKVSPAAAGTGGNNVPAGPSSGGGTSNIPLSASAPALPTKNMSIEESVKTFRLFEALRNGDTLAISKAIRESASPELETGIEIHGILYLAVQCAETQVVQFVMSSTSRDPEASPTGGKPFLDINYRDPATGNTALHLAAQLGRTPIVSLLLREPSINDALVNVNGAQAIDMARSAEIAQELTLSRSIYLDDHISQLNDYISRQEYDKLTELLETPRTRMLLDLNVQDGGVPGSTLLHEAARRKDTRLIQILLLHGADPFRRDRKGKLPQDVTKDEKTKAVLKKSPAAMAAQQSIQEKAVLGSGAGILGVEEGHTVGEGPAKEGREMKGYLKKWTNYTGGYKLRWFVLENGVLSYYKHQDDMESACRGAINMRIARLHMDPQDKLRFEILGKSSVKYHLKANHQVEAKRWYWALNNAIQWAKDEAKDEEERKKKMQAQLQAGKAAHTSGSIASEEFERVDASSDYVASERRLSRPHSGLTRVRTTGEGSVMGDTDNELNTASEGERGTAAERMPDRNSDDDDGDDYEMLDDNSSHGREEPHSQDSFNLAAHSAKLQLDLLAHIGSALTSESTKHPNMPISNPGIMVALSSYNSAVQNLKGLVGELLKMSRERDAYWKYRLDKEVDLRKIWEENMTKLAVEQEQLEDRMGRVEEKRKRTKRALREVLKEGGTPRRMSEDQPRDLAQALDKLDIDNEVQLKRKKSTLKQVDLALSDSDEMDASDEEFFDAVDAGEVEVALEMPSPVQPTPATQYGTLETEDEKVEEVVERVQDEREKQLLVIKKSFRGYEDPPRFKFDKAADDRPKISLWGILKSMIGKDMTKMTLPVSFNECTSLLQRVAEDMEYTDLLDSAAERLESTERLVYVAAFAASEYSSTINRIAKPFNPLLGETYEYCRPDKNFRFFVEQVSHHPPIGAAWAEAPRWEYWGESSVRSKFYGKSFDINPLGTWFLKLRPASGGEELYTWKKVNTSVIGIITGSPTVDNYGPMEIRNHTTGDVCHLEFKARGWRSAGAYEVKGRVLDNTETQRWSIGGRWNDKLYARLSHGYDAAIHSPPAGLPANVAGNKSPTGAMHTATTFSTDAAFLVWQTHERPPAPFNLTPFAISLNYLPENLKPHLCPTDTRLRPDQRAMEDGQYDFAATEKNRLEEKQRAKRREREQNGELYNPRWFYKSRCEVTGEDFWQTNREYWVNRDKVSNGGEWESVPDIF